MEAKRPTKEQLRKYLYDRHKSSAPPPTPEQIRRELSWNMLPENRSR